MRYKLKYSSLLSLKVKKNNLYLKGPLGKNIIEIPYSILCLLDNKKKIIIFYSYRFSKKKRVYISGFLSLFFNSCRTIIFGDLIGLNLKGLGLKFVSLSSINLSKKGFLVMNLGYSDPVFYFIDYNRSIFFLLNSRNIFCYSINFSFIRNYISSLYLLKKPDNYKKKGFIIVDIIC